MRKRLLALSLGISIILTIILSSLLLVSFDRQDFSGDKEEILDFLKGDSGLSSGLLSEREMLHMQDVRHLFDIAICLFYFSMALLLVSLFFLIRSRQYAVIAKTFIASSLSLLGLMIVLSLLDFSSLFNSFHRIFFTNDLWKLSAESFLIKSFPASFFKNKLSRMMFFITLISSAILINGLVLRFSRKKNVHA